MKITINGFEMDIPVSTVKAGIEQLRKNPEFVAARANIPRGTGIVKDFPLFHLVVESGKYTLHNVTDYDVDTDYTNKKKQLQYFDEYSAKNVEEGGKAVKRVTVVVNTEKSPAGHDTFSNGWKPFQDKIVSKNNVRSYMVEFVDGTNTGWLSWRVANDAQDAVWNAGHVLRNLASSSNYCFYVRLAVEQCVKTR